MQPFGQSFRTSNKGDNTMFTKAMLGLAVIFFTASGGLAAAKTQSIAPSQNVYNPAGAYVTDHRASDCVHVAFPQCGGGGY
jgi:hypothetical protein